MPRLPDERGIVGFDGEGPGWPINDGARHDAGNRSHTNPSEVIEFRSLLFLKYGSELFHIGVSSAIRFTLSVPDLAFHAPQRVRKCYPSKGWICFYRFLFDRIFRDGCPASIGERISCQRGHI